MGGRGQKIGDRRQKTGDRRLKIGFLIAPISTVQGWEHKQVRKNVDDCTG